jgi:hypothetical protein
MAAYRVSLVIGFQPKLSIAKQEAVLNCLEALGPESVDCTEAQCTIRHVVRAEHSVAAKQEAETAVARALFGAGHTMQSAPIVSTSVEPV